TLTGQVGAFINGSDIKLTNFGSVVTTYAGVVVWNTADAVTIDNRASIYGATYGILALGPNTVVNSGTIEGGANGITLGSASVSTVTNSGILKGGGYAINQLAGTTGALNLTNSGNLIGAIHLTAAAAADNVVNSGVIGGAVYLGGGADLFMGTGGIS